MKKIYLLICLISFTMQAKYYKAVLTLENGTTKSGFAKMVEIGDSKVKFRLTEKGNDEKILSSEIKKIEYFEKENSFVAERLFFHKNKEEKGVKKGTKKHWLYVIYSDGIKLAVDVGQSTLRYNAFKGTSTGSAGGTSLYIGKEKEDGVFFVFYLSDMKSVNIGMDKSVRKQCKLLFNDCPKFLEAVNAENFKKPTLKNRLVELYNNNCNNPTKAKTEVNKKKNQKKKK